MKKYQSYRDSGVEWIGEIPSHWKMKRVKYLFEIRKRISGELGYDVLSVTQKGLKVKDIESGKGQISMDYTKYQIVEPGDFVMNHMDLLTGYVDVSNKLGVTSPDYRVFSLIDQESFTGYYLGLFQFGYMNKIFYGFGQGSSLFGRWRLPTRNFNGFKLPYPRSKEQQQIVEFLETKTSLIDSLILKSQKKIDLLKEKRLKLIEQAIINSDVQRIRLYHVADIIQRPINRIESESYTKIGMYNWGRGIFQYKEQMGIDLGDSTFFYLKEGDLVISGQFAWEGAVSIASENENGCVASHRFHIIRGKSGILYTDYLWAYFTSQEGHFLLDDNSIGSAGRNRPLNIGKLLKEKVPVPNIEYQQKILDLIKTERQYKQYATNSIKLLKEYRQSLISEVVTGKIRVCKEDYSSILEPKLEEYES